MILVDLKPLLPLVQQWLTTVAIHNCELITVSKKWLILVYYVFAT